jgi:RNA polymerase sigma factor (sigma-70 family)
MMHLIRKERTIMPEHQEAGLKEARPHPWEHLEPRFQLLIWVKPGCRDWNEAVNEVTPAVIATVVGFVSGRTNGDVRRLAEDIAQEWWKTTFPRLCETHDPDQPFFPYGHEALRRLCLAQRRSVAHRELPGLSHEPPDDRQNPVRDGQRRELRRMIGGALWKLPKQDRQAVVLRYWKGVSLAEAAERQGCPANTLYTRVRRGLHKLKALLAGLADFLGE